MYASDVRLDGMDTKELLALADAVAAELEKRGEDDPQYLKGFEAGEYSASGCLCGDPDC